MAWRPWIGRGLTLLAGSLGLALVAALLAGVLRAGGDRSAAVAVSGVLWVSLAVAGLTLIGQVVLLSLESLQRPPPPRRSDDHSPEG